MFIFNPLVLSFLIKQFINKVLEQLLSITFFNIFEATIKAHETCNLVELAHSSKILPLVLKQLLEALFLLLSAETSFIPLSCLLFIDKLVEGGFSLGQSFQCLDADVMRSNTLRIVPAPSGCHSGCFQSILEDSDAIFLREGIQLGLSSNLRTLGS